MFSTLKYKRPVKERLIWKLPLIKNCKVNFINKRWLDELFSGAGRRGAVVEGGRVELPANGAAHGSGGGEWGGRGTDEGGGQVAWSERGRWTWRVQTRNIVCYKVAILLLFESDSVLLLKRKKCFLVWD